MRGCFQGQTGNISKDWKSVKEPYFVVSFFENFIVFPPEFIELSVSPFFLLVFLAIGEEGLLFRLQPIQAVLHCYRKVAGVNQKRVESHDAALRA